MVFRNADGGKGAPVIPSDARRACEADLLSPGSSASKSAKGAGSAAATAKKASRATLTCTSPVVMSGFTLFDERRSTSLEAVAAPAWWWVCFGLLRRWDDEGFFSVDDPQPINSFVALFVWNGTETNL